MEKKLEENFANQVYDILVEFGNAREEERIDFIYHHCVYEYPCTEWRFCGKFGFGGKYRSTYNGVSAYQETINEQIQKDLDLINKKLKNLKN